MKSVFFANQVEAMMSVSLSKHELLIPKHELLILETCYVVLYKLLINCCWFLEKQLFHDFKIIALHSKTRILLKVYLVFAGVYKQYFGHYLFFVVRIMKLVHFVHFDIRKKLKFD